MKKLKLSSLLLVIIISYACSPNDEDIDYSPITIFDRIEASPNYSYLSYALQKTGLSSILDGSEKYTLFAPSNMVFLRFLMENNFSTIDDVPNSLLRNVLLNHVVSEELRYSRFQTGYKKTAAISDANGLPLSIYIEQINMRVTLNGQSRITNGNIMASNGIIHVVNNVIPIPSVVTFVEADFNLSSLAQALTREDLTTDFISVLNTSADTSPAPFTVFAPNPKAFADLLDELGLQRLSLIDEPTLNSTLTYHVIPGTNALSSDLSDNLQLNTLGGPVVANVTGGATITVGNNRVSKIVEVDIQANNGVIHVIDKVILPK